jgi:hypothetical protein
MIIDTLTFSNKAQGWTSRWTYRPEWMVGLNSSFYSFKNGDLYQHDTNQNRTQFYDQPINDPNFYGFSVETIFNESPMEIKMFKTLSLDCTTGLNVEGYTDLDQVEMLKDQFVNKEGEFYSYIRRPQNDVDYELLSTQGVGVVSQVVSNTIAIAGEMTNVNVKDIAYGGVINGTQITPFIIGEISSVTPTSITVVSGSTLPAAGNYLFVVKQSSVESYGARGYYLNLKLSLSGPEATSDHELFAIKSSLFKSFP